MGDIPMKIIVCVYKCINEVASHRWAYTCNLIKTCQFEGIILPFQLKRIRNYIMIIC